MSLEIVIIIVFQVVAIYFGIQSSKNYKLYSSELKENTQLKEEIDILKSRRKADKDHAINLVKLIKE
jgi:hypothetical protein